MNYFRAFEFRAPTNILIMVAAIILSSLSIDSFAEDGNTARQDEAARNQVMAQSKPGSSDFVDPLAGPLDISEFRIMPPPHSEYFNVYVKKQGDKWVIQERQSDSNLCCDPDSEAISIDVERRILSSPVSTERDGRRNSVAVTGLSRDKPAFDCTGGLKRSSDSGSQRIYNLCHSAFGKVRKSPMTVVSNTFSTIFTLGLQLRTLEYDVDFDPETLRKIADESGAIEYARNKLFNIRSAKYHDQFQKIKTSADAKKFQTNWMKYDPENRVTEARSLEVSLATTESEAREEIRLRQQEIAERERELRRKENERLKAEQEILRKKMEAEQLEENKRIASWRTKLNIETKTNCGPIIEIKGNLIKVYAPVANYGNEHWIERGTLFPAEYGCSFRNGVYQPPGTY